MLWKTAQQFKTSGRQYQTTTDQDKLKKRKSFHMAPMYSLQHALSLQHSAHKDLAKTKTTAFYLLPRSGGAFLQFCHYTTLKKSKATTIYYPKFQKNKTNKTPGNVVSTIHNTFNQNLWN